MTTALTNSTTGHEAAFDVLASLNTHAEALRSGDQKARDAMVTDCFALIAKLETPGETFMRSMWTHSMHPTIWRVASDTKLYKALGMDESPKTTDQLAAATGTDPILTRKVLQNLAAMHTVVEIDVNSFAPTPLSNCLAEQTWIEALEFFVPYTNTATLKTPEFLKETGFRMPTDFMDTPMQYAHGGRGKMHMQDLLRRDGQSQGLASLMKLWLDKRPHWSDEKVGFFPVRKRLIEGANDSSDAIFMVDVGGSQGQDFLRLLTHIDAAEIPGRLIVQDQTHVVESIADGSLPSKIEKMAHDFFTPQPVQGARTYFMHNIIHNFPDAKAKEILKQTAAAMKKGYSKLLIWDVVLPDKGAGVNGCCLDWVMLTFFASSERTETEWRKLLEDPELGLKITDIVHFSQYDQDVIELEIA